MFVRAYVYMCMLIYIYMYVCMCVYMYMYILFGSRYFILAGPSGQGIRIIFGSGDMAKITQLSFLNYFKNVRMQYNSEFFVLEIL